MSVEVRDDMGPGWTKTVFIDDEQLRLQCCEDPIVEGDICIVRCITDEKMSPPLDPGSVPKKYQVKPYMKSIETTGVNKGREITTFYLKLG